MGLSQGPRPGQPSWELARVGRWRHLVHRHGSNLLGGVMVTVMLCALVLVVLAS
jgi:hypothetical protein